MSKINTQEAWLLLNKTPGLGSVRIRKILNSFSSIEDVFYSNLLPKELNLPSKTLEYLKKPDLNSIKYDLLWLEKENNHLLTISDELYPPLLKNIETPPPLLYVTGDANICINPQLAVVGSRNATVGGINNTKLFCSDLAATGLTITSGMALGVDAQAHQSALAVKGKTIAVLGTGLDIVYPSRNQKLAHQIAEHGALISEFPIGTKPHAHNFPRRNRIISGLSLGTLVIEASLKSGTLITARQTMEINRPVMAIPGSIHNPLAKGCHQLIKQGAKLVESAEEILEELAPLAQSLNEQLQSTLASLNSNDDVKREEMPDDHQKVFRCIAFDATPVDEIITDSGLKSSEVSSILLLLELENKIQALPGAHYSKL